MAGYKRKSARKPQVIDEPGCTVRLIPPSGSDPDLRDDVDRMLEDRLLDLDRRLTAIRSEVELMRGTRDFQDRARRIALKREHRELYCELKRTCHDIMISMEAAYAQHFGKPKDDKARRDR